MAGVKADFAEEDDLIVREIFDVAELLDVSLVVRPAFPSTEVQLHALDEWRRQRPKPRLLTARLRQLAAATNC